MTGRANAWPPERDAKLAELWNKGLTAREIEAEMLREFQVAVTKNAIVGRAHRLKLPARPSPIKRGAISGLCAAPRPPKPRAVKPARQEVPGAGASRRSEQRHLMARLGPVPRDRSLGVSSLNSAPVAAVNGGVGVLFDELRPAHCRWPLWDDETPAQTLRAQDGLAGGILRAEKFAYCGCDRVEGRPYCEGHVALAYVKAPPVKVGRVGPDWNDRITGAKAFER